ITLFGTTGEGPAFTVAERQGLLEALLEAGIRADQCIVTTTALALGDAIAVGRHAARLGVHRQMFMPPFYFNQPPEAGIADSVTQVIDGIADADLRLLLYHFPAMSTFGFSHPLIAELVRRHPQQVVGVKDSSGDLAHSVGLVQAFAELSVLVGAEPHVAPVMVAGGAGSINGLGNIAPGLMRRILNGPHAMSEADTALMSGLLGLLSVRPNMNFVATYKVMLAEQTSDDTWLNIRAPLHRLGADAEQAIRQGYRALGTALQSI
ncbi:MAG: dihydrodipicolinate synthase family protein, partial [Burkholderiales bacterium]|nr:dihydrodipicolinate synthase family protein [Burkholderiales bacterium]